MKITPPSPVPPRGLDILVLYISNKLRYSLLGGLIIQTIHTCIHCKFIFIKCIQYTETKEAEKIRKNWCTCVYNIMYSILCIMWSCHLATRLSRGELAVTCRTWLPSTVEDQCSRDCEDSGHLWEIVWHMVHITSMILGMKPGVRVRHSRGQR
jgi:hypothetical protein